MDYFVKRDCSKYLFGTMSSCENKEMAMPHGMTNADGDALSDLATTVLIPRIISLLNTKTALYALHPPHAPSMSLSQVVPFAGFLAAADAVSTTWPKIVSAFKTTSSTHYVQTITSVGFSHLDAVTDVQHNQNIPMDQAGEFLNYILPFLEVYHALVFYNTLMIDSLVCAVV
jgi:hypothetical protein